MVTGINTKVSDTASYTCFYRASASLDRRKPYHGEDNMAMLFIPLKAKPIIYIPFLRGLVLKRTPPGTYEYVIARTRYFDEMFSNVLKDGFEQVVILGAGFDTRALRFNSLNTCTKIFELDSAVTQKAKRKILSNKHVYIPDSLHFIPIDFNRDSLPDSLHQAGFKDGVRTLFLMEGVTMYISPDAICNTFNFMTQRLGEDSLVVFDYISASVLRRENKYYGEKELFKGVSKAGEGFTFGIDERKIGNFLSKFNMSLVDHSSAFDLEKKYFTGIDGEPVGRVNGAHNIVTARISLIH